MFVYKGIADFACDKFSRFACDDFTDSTTSPESSWSGDGSLYWKIWMFYQSLDISKVVITMGSELPY